MLGYYGNFRVGVGEAYDYWVLGPLGPVAGDSSEVLLATVPIPKREIMQPFGM